MSSKLSVICLLLSILFAPCVVFAAPFKTIDLADIDDDSELIQRVYGSVGDGRYGVPVAGGHDMDGDGHLDYAFAAMIADPLSRINAGQVFLVFGDGTIGSNIDTGISNDRVVPIYGSGAHEHTGSEIWMADVTGDGLGDLIICRQDYSQSYTSGDGVNSNSIGTGEGAMTIIPGDEDLRTSIEAIDGVVDLAADNSGLSITHIIGANAGDRFCMWARAGDLSGDGIDDLAVSADQEDSNSQTNAGAVYVFRGGSHLAGSGEVDLNEFGDMPATVFPNNVIRITPPINPTADITLDGNTVSSPVPVNQRFGCVTTSACEFHFGSTLNIANLDETGAAELIIAAGFARAGGILQPRSGLGGIANGGSRQGTVYILWEDNFAEDGTTNDWSSNDQNFTATIRPGSLTVIDGGINHDAFGEEIIGGLDYDGDTKPDVYFGDLTADGLAGVTSSRSNAGSGHIFYSAAALRNVAFDFDSPPQNQQIANFLGPIAGAIGGDTTMHGDFNMDGIADIATSSPHDNRFNRTNAGTLHVMLGKDGGWPTTMDFAINNFPSADDIQVINIHGAEGQNGADLGDTLAYSGTAGDLDQDGFVDIIINEMIGSGVAPGTENVGNLLIISGKLMSEFTLPPRPISDELCLPVKTANDSVSVICL